MKDLLRGGVVALILGTLILTGRSWSEPKLLPTPRTRIAGLNLGFVMKKYQKCQDLQAEIQSEIKKIQDKETAFLQNLRECMDDIAIPNTPEAKKVKYEWIIGYMKEKRDGNPDSPALTVLRKRSEEGMANLYREVCQAVARYARDNDIKLVLQFNDADEKSQLAASWNPENVALNMPATPCRPLSVAPGVDISTAIITALNAGEHHK